MRFRNKLQFFELWMLALKDESGLIRDQVYKSENSSQYGSVLLSNVANSKIVNIFLVIFFISVIYFFGIFEVTHKISSRGQVVTEKGLLPIATLQEGSISKLLVHEGQHVSKGDILFVVMNEHGNSLGVSSSASVSNSLRARYNDIGNQTSEAKAQYDIKSAALQSKISSIQSSIIRAKSQIELQYKKIDLVKSNIERYKSLLSKNYISLPQLQQKESELLDEQQKLNDLENNLADLQAEIAVARSDMAEVAVQSRREDINLKINAKEIEAQLAENEGRRESFVKAPEEGTITAINATIGRPVSPGAVLAKLIPSKTALEAEVYVNSRSINSITPGTLVVLRYQAFPYQKFGVFRAKVREVSTVPIDPTELKLSDSMLSDKGEPVYRVRLSLLNEKLKDGKPIPPLSPGMLLDANFVLEKRKIIDIMLEPLKAASYKLN